MKHGGNLPLRLVGKLSLVLLPGGGNGRMGDLRGGETHNGGHSVVSGEVDALPGRGTFTFAVVLHIQVVVGGGADLEGDSGLFEACASLGHTVQDVTLRLHVVLVGAEDVVEVAGLGLLGLRPGGHDSGLASLLHGKVGHRAAGTQGAEGGTLPGAVHVVRSTAVRAYIYIVVSIGGEAGEFAGQCCAFIGVGTRIGFQSGGVKLSLAIDDLVTAHIVASRCRPRHRGTRLGNVARLNASHCRAGLVGLAIVESQLGNKSINSTGAISLIARRTAVRTIEAHTFINSSCQTLKINNQISAIVHKRSTERNGNLVGTCDNRTSIYGGEACR